MRWSRERAEQAVSDRLWRYSGAARLAPGGPAPADVGESIGPDAFDTVMNTYLAVSPAAEQMLAAVGDVLRRTPGTVQARPMELYGEVEGAVDWPVTFERRLRTGDETLFACRFGRRRYETLPTRVLRTALELCEEVTRGLSYDGSPLAVLCAERLERARTLQRHTKLTGVRALRQPNDAQLNRAAARTGLGPVVDYIQLVLRVKARQPDALKDLLSSVLVTPSADDRLFELQAGFAIVEACVQKDWTLTLLQAVTGSKLPFARLSREGEEVVIWQQRAVSTVIRPLPAPSRYSEYRTANGMNSAAFLPDYLIRLPDGRVIVVEVKLTAGDGSQHVARGITDVMAYIHDHPALYDDEGAMPHGIVVAWGAGAVPNLGVAIAVTDLDQVQQLQALF